MASKNRVPQGLSTVIWLGADLAIDAAPFKGSLRSVSDYNAQGAGSISWQAGSTLNNLTTLKRAKATDTVLLRAYTFNASAAFDLDPALGVVAVVDAARVASEGSPTNTGANLFIFHHCLAVLPGESGWLQGQFPADARVYASDGSQTYGPLPVVVQEANQVIYTLPLTFAVTEYEVWVADGTGRSAGKRVNAPRLHQADSPEVLPTGKLFLQGRNLQVIPGLTSARLFDTAGNSYPAAVTVSTSSPDELDITWSGLPVGAVLSVGVRNGLREGGTEAVLPYTVTVLPAGPDELGLGVPWAVKFAAILANKYNVRTDSRLSLKAQGDGVTDDLPAIQAAMDMARDAGGGTVYLPGGYTYKWLQPASHDLACLEHYNNVVLLGDGKRTKVKVGFANKKGSFGFMAAFAGGSRMGWANFDLENLNQNNDGIGGIGPFDRGIFQRGDITEFFWHNVRCKGFGEGILFGSKLTKALFQGCALENRYITGGVYPNGTFTSNSSDFLTFRRNRCTWEVGQQAFNGGHTNLIVEDNELVRDLANQPTEVRADGLTYAIDTRTLALNYLRGCTVRRNTAVNINGNALSLADDEFLMTEDGGPAVRNEFFGAVTSSTGRTLSCAAMPTAINGQTTVHIVGGKGQGQYRTLSSYDLGAKTLTVASDWEVQPDATSWYSLNDFSMRDSLLKANTCFGKRGGAIVFYRCSTANMRIVDCQATNSVGFWFQPGQTVNDDHTKMRFSVQYNTEVIDSAVRNNGSITNGSHIALNPIFQGKDYLTLRGTSVVGFVCRRSKVKGWTSYARNTQYTELAYEGITLEVITQNLVGDDLNTIGSARMMQGVIIENPTTEQCPGGVRLNEGASYVAVLGHKAVNCPAPLLIDRTGIQVNPVGHVYQAAAATPIVLS